MISTKTSPRLVSAVLLVISLLLIYWLSAGPAKTTPSTPVDVPIRIAACPTLLPALAPIADRIQPVPTQSTADSLALLAAGLADYALAGRTLKPSEPNWPNAVLGRGYSLLSAQEMTLDRARLGQLKVYTDIDEAEVTHAFGIDAIHRVENVYDHLDQGIIITTWENTDYGQAEVVHLLDSTGRRDLNSRLPIVYCSQTCDDQVVSWLKMGLKNI